MSKQAEQLKALTTEQRKLIKKLLDENHHLKLQIEILRNRIQDLEQLHVIVDREVAEIPFGFDLIPEDDLNRN